MAEIKILGISGSLRRDSYNTALLRVARELVPPHVEMELADISQFPIYNSDLEKMHGFPEPVEVFRNQIESADALLFATPEYNWSVTGALKNAIDWASRSPSPMNEMPAAIMGAGGRSGTARSQGHLRDILAHNRLRLVADPEVMVAGVWDKFVDGTLIDEDTRASVSKLVHALADLI